MENFGTVEWVLLIISAVVVTIFVGAGVVRLFLAVFMLPWWVFAGLAIWAWLMIVK